MLLALAPLALLLTAAGPVAGPVPDAAPSIPFERYTLPNGMEVILHQDPRAPLVVVDVWYHVGSGNEVPGKSGFAHLFEHMMFQGSVHTGRDQHFQILSNAGASNINGTTNPDRTNYFEIVPENELETALWLESDRLGFLLPLLDDAQLKNQIDVVRNERRQRYDNVPYGKELFAISAGLYPEGHPYRYLTIGRHEDLENASVDDVKAFFTTWYTPQNATLLVAGDFDAAKTKALIEKYFGPLGTGGVGKAIPKAPKKPAPKTPTLKKTSRTVLEDGFARLPRVQYAWHSGKFFSDEDVDLDVLSMILGADGWGRLYKRLVVQEQLAQSVNASQNSRGWSSSFQVGVTLKPGSDLATVEKIVAEELARLIKEGPSAAEVLRAQNGLEASMVFPLDELLARAERLQSHNHYTGDPGSMPALLTRYRATTPKGLQKTAKKVLGQPRVEVVTLPAPSTTPSTMPSTMPTKPASAGGGK
jgi:zinc protease